MKRSKAKIFWNSVFGNAQLRYESRHDILSAVSSRLGFRLYNRNLSWLHDREFKEIWKEFPEYNGYIHERKFTLYYLSKSLRSVPGDIAECGVFRAGSSFLMLSACPDKHLHGFDSFEGLSAPGTDDRIENDHSFKWKHHDMAVGEDVARKNLAKFADRFDLHKGWIPQRFPEVKDKKFALVHIDVDLYEPTKDSLEFFWPRLTPGGMIVCDDYGSEACPGAKKAMDEFFAKQRLSVIHLTTGQGLVFKVS